MANSLLGHIPELSDLLILVDPFGRDHSAQSNVRPLKEAITWLKRDGMLVVFPAGEVAHARPSGREITDPPWSETVARLIRICEAPALPVFFTGSNSMLFQAAGFVHARLRTALLPHELLNKRDKRLTLCIGKPIPFDVLAGFGTDAEMTAYLRQRTFVLRHKTPAGVSQNPFFPRDNQGSAFSRLTPIVRPTEPSAVLQDVRMLPSWQVLVESGDYAVFHATAVQIPNLLREIGRQREIAFRQVGEGTGRAIDLDEFDQYYTHLCLWNTRKDELVGAYRLGRADEILRKQGISGLYTQTLFDYDSRLLERLGPALELGRSFVKAEYQRTPMPLFLLWKGISQYVLRFPHYRTLFGPVSISSAYSAISQRLMVEFLECHGYMHELAGSVRGKRPFIGRPIKGWNSGLVPDLAGLAAIISELENHEKGLPVLLREYLRLGGKLLGFNVDPQFNNSLDGLIVVDLMRAERRVLARYMGERGLATFLDYHQNNLAAVS